MKRRTFIKGSVVSSAAIIPFVYSCSSGTFSYDHAIAEPVYLSMIWDTEKILSTGEQYITVKPKNKREKQLVKKLLEGVNTTGLNQLDEVNNKVINDFKNNKTIILDGWILSETEAQQCALLTIQKPE